MSNYFKGIDKSAFPLLVRFIEAVDGDIEFANIETVLLTLDQIRTSPRGVVEGWAEEWLDKYNEVRNQMTAYTFKRLDVGSEITNDNWAANMLELCGPNTTVISMNYDNLAERILACRRGLFHLKHGSKLNCPHCKLIDLLHRACNCGSRVKLSDDSWRGALLKPHGSITWRRCLNHDCCSYECLVADEICRPFQPCSCPHCKQPCSPVMVMPTLNKNLNEIPEISVMWQAARKALSEAESIFIFGFSMPRSDELLIQMIRNSIHCKKRLKRLCVVDLKPDAVIDRFKRCIPMDCDIITAGFPVSGIGPPEWLLSGFYSQVYVI